MDSYGIPSVDKWKEAALILVPIPFHIMWYSYANCYQAKVVCKNLRKTDVGSTSKWYLVRSFVVTVIGTTVIILLIPAISTLVPSSSYIAIETAMIFLGVTFLSYMIVAPTTWVHRFIDKYLYPFKKERRSRRVTVKEKSTFNFLPFWFLDKGLMKYCHPIESHLL